MNREDILRAFALRKLRQVTAAPTVDVLSRLFDKQLEFVSNPSKLKVAKCSRRAGKTESGGTGLFDAGQRHPGAIVPYIALTRDSAKRIMWPVLEEMNEKLGLGAVPTESALTMTLPNRSRIMLFGADMKNFIKRLRGPKYPRVIIDEAQGFGSHLEELIDDVILPATADYNGDVWMLGTPGPVPKGYFYEASQGGKGFTPFAWTLFDNPHMPNARAFVEEMVKRKGWSKDNPTLLREWYGQWVFDSDSLVYKYKEGRNDYDRLPENTNFYRILGIDFGWNDAAAFSIVTYSENSPRVWVEHCEGQSKMIPTEIALRARQLIERFKPVKVVADTGGLGKSIAEEMIRRYGIPVHPAQKTEKMTNIRLMNGDFIDGNVLVHTSLTNLKDQYLSLSLNDKGVETPGEPNDYCDATLYAYREAKAYAHEPVEVLTPTERLEREERQMIEDAEKELSDSTPWYLKG